MRCIFFLVVSVIIRFSNSKLVKCNGTVLGLQICNMQEKEYDENFPHGSPGNPLTIKSTITVEKISELDDKENTITLNFLFFTVWHDPRISLESNDPEDQTEWFAVNELDQSRIYTPTIKIVDAKTVTRTGNYGATDKDSFWFFNPDNR